MSRLVACLAALVLAVPVLAAPEVHNLAQPFADFWDRSEQQPLAQRIALFKTDIAPLFPAFYGSARFAGVRTQAQLDERIGRAITSFGPIRADYLRKSRQFEQDLPRYTASFSSYFPEYRQNMPIYFLHSLGEMDGGPRQLEGRDYLVFGIESMVRYHGAGDEAAFFHHELFHTYHASALRECAGSALWTHLWSEGLATYVSHVMNPQSDEKALLLDFPSGMPARTRAALGPAWRQLESVMDTSDEAQFSELFTVGGGEASGLPARRGYYLGYLVAQEAGRTRTVQQLARLDCAASHALVKQTVGRLKTAP